MNGWTNGWNGQSLAKDGRRSQCERGRNMASHRETGWSGRKEERKQKLMDEVLYGMHRSRKDTETDRQTYIQRQKGGMKRHRITDARPNLNNALLFWLQALNYWLTISGHVSGLGRIFPPETRAHARGKAGLPGPGLLCRSMQTLSNPPHFQHECHRLRAEVCLLFVLCTDVRVYGRLLTPELWWDYTID